MPEFSIHVVAWLDSRKNDIERFEFEIKGEDLVVLKSQVYMRLNNVIKKLAVKENVHCDITIEKDGEWYDTDTLCIVVTEKGVEYEN